ncbi:hypothetical protein [Desulfitobacterium sp. PCE1]|uniref:hypothetical protein n=1 Tax=Desulfitobacterium sp. PCE1 TaxID=146907 RepID=UPI0003816865|nr:hypothetical protein [Desulfitobacterium sp. PCE1]
MDIAESYKIFGEILTEKYGEEFDYQNMTINERKLFKEFLLEYRSFCTQVGQEIDQAIEVIDQGVKEIDVWNAWDQSVIVTEN